MEALFLLFVFWIVLTMVTVVGHAIWLMCEAVVHSLSSTTKQPSISPASVPTWRCQACASHVRANWLFCGDCGTPRDHKSRLLRELAATKRQLEAFSKDNKIDVTMFQQLNAIIEDERTRLTNPQPVSVAPTPAESNQETF